MKLFSFSGKILLGIVLLGSVSSLSLAAGNHEGGHSHDMNNTQHNAGHNHGDMKNGKGGMFLKEKQIEPYF